MYLLLRVNAACSQKGAKLALIKSLVQKLNERPLGGPTPADSLPVVSERCAFLIPRLVGVVEAGEPAADVVSVVHRLDQSVRAHGPDYGLAQL